MEKKLVALLLVLVMLFNVLPIGVFATAIDGDFDENEKIAQVEQQTEQKIADEIRIGGGTQNPDDSDAVALNTTLEKTMENTTIGLKVAIKVVESIKARRAEYGDRLTQRLIAGVVRAVSKVLSVSDWALRTTKLPGLTKRKIQNVTTLGDSTVMGFGFEDIKELGNGFGFASQQAYPAYLASKYGLSNYYGDYTPRTYNSSAIYKRSEEQKKTKNELAQFAIPALKTIDMRLMLEKGKDKGLWSILWGIPGKVVDDIKDQIHYSDLVTVGFGGNDVMQEMLLPLLLSELIKEIPKEQLAQLDDPLKTYIENYNMDSSEKVNTILNVGQTLDQNQIETVKKAADAITKFLDTIMPGKNTQEAINASTNTFVYYMLLAYAIYAGNFSKLVTDILEINPDAQIVVMGLFNPLEFYYQKYEDDPRTRIDLTLLGDTLFSYLNASMKKAALEHRNNCCYVNCKGVMMNIDMNRNLYSDSETDLMKVLIKNILFTGENAQYFEEFEGKDLLSVLRNGVEQNDLLKILLNFINNFMGMIHQNPQGHHDIYARLMESALCQPHHAHSLELKKVGITRYAYKCVDSLCKENGIDRDHCNDLWYHGCGQLFKDPYGRTWGSLTKKQVLALAQKGIVSATELQRVGLSTQN